MLVDSLLVILAYLFGSLSTAVIVAKAMGLPDPRTVGSKNPGATNVLRHGGKKAAALTLAGDLIKGVIPVLVAQAMGVTAEVLAAVGVAAFLGHLYPVFFGFQGGKGVATAGGVLLAVAWPVGLGAVGTWLVMAFITRISSLSALTAAAATPFYMWWATGSMALTVMNAVLSVLLIWRHRSNIRHIIEGTEGRISLR